MQNGATGTLTGGELTESKILSYLSGYNNANYGHGSNARFGYKCYVLTDEAMKEQSFVDELNILIEANDGGTITETPQTVWKKDTTGINNGYPIFTWQTVGANSQ